MAKNLVAHVNVVASRIGLPLSAPDWNGTDAVWLLLEKMKEDGAVVIIKLDGERKGEDDNGPYTALVSGPPLGGDAIRTDAHVLEEALAYVICLYAERFWGISRPS